MTLLVVELIADFLATDPCVANMEMKTLLLFGGLLKTPNSHSAHGCLGSLNSLTLLHPLRKITSPQKVSQRHLIKPFFFSRTLSMSCIHLNVDPLLL